VIDHPLLKHKISLLRDVNTQKKEFQELGGFGDRGV
jgi:uracil phosphoribosyltransferase